MESKYVRCPICGRKNEEKETFWCKKCERDNLCLSHQNPETYCCEECTKKETGNTETGRQSIEIVRCPICGRKNPVSETFHCNECGRDDLCLTHQDSDTYLCETCMKEKGESEEEEEPEEEEECRDDMEGEEIEPEDDEEEQEEESDDDENEEEDSEESEDDDDTPTTGAKDISDALMNWQMTYGIKRTMFGGQRMVNGWKWPTKRELRNAMGIGESDFESALEEAIDNLSVKVRNGRVGLTSVFQGTDGKSYTGEF